MSERACFSCGDPISSDRKCKRKDCRCPEDPRCWTCHIEVIHGLLPNVTGDGVLGGNPRAGNAKGEPSPWGENNVRTMEDGAER